MTIQFSPNAERALQLAYDQLAQEHQPAYDRLVKALSRLDRDASLFTLTESATVDSVTGSPNRELNVVVLDAAPHPAVAIWYFLHRETEDVTVQEIAW